MLVLSSNLHGYNLTAVSTKLNILTCGVFAEFFVVYLWQVSSCSVSYLTLKSASAQKQPTNSTQLSNALLNNIAVRTRDGNACSVLCTMQDFHITLDFHCFDPILKASIVVLCYTCFAIFLQTFLNITLYLGSPEEATMFVESLSNFLKSIWGSPAEV